MANYLHKYCEVHLYMPTVIVWNQAQFDSTVQHYPDPIWSLEYTDQELTTPVYTYPVLKAEDEKRLKAADNKRLLNLQFKKILRFAAYKNIDDPKYTSPDLLRYINGMHPLFYSVNRRWETNSETREYIRYWHMERMIKRRYSRVKVNHGLVRKTENPALHAPLTWPLAGMRGIDVEVFDAYTSERVPL